VGEGHCTNISAGLLGQKYYLPATKRVYYAIVVIINDHV